MAWYEHARFDTFCECDVFVESDGHFLYVENTPHDGNGNYICNEYQMGTNVDNTAFYIRFDTSCAGNEYISGLEMAPWNIARDIIGIELDRLAYAESLLYNDTEEGNETVEFIKDAKRCLMEHANENEKFIYC